MTDVYDNHWRPWMDMNNRPLLQKFFWLVLAVDALASNAEPSRPIELAADLERFRAESKIPGMVALVLRGDQIIAQGAVGVRKQGASGPITLQDELHIGSCTKAMTASLAAMLVDEGTLKWNDTLSELFGDWVKDMHPAWKEVTLRMVLVHRAGLPRGNDPAVGLDPQLIAPDQSPSALRQALVKSQLSREPETAPGTKEVYSNVGYIIVGAALEKVTRTAWEDLMQKRLFESLGITSGGFGAPGTPGTVDQPWGHDRKGEPMDPGRSNADLPRFAGPCGTVHMRITDWAKFITLHLRGDAANPNRHVALLSAQAFDELHRASSGETYSPGWALGTIDCAKGTHPGDQGKIFGHEGSNGYWYSKVLVAPEIDLAVLVVCNRGGAGIGGKAVAGAAVELLKQFGSAPTNAR